MTDRILLTDIAFYGYHGASAEEKRLGQKFLVDVELRLDLRPAGQADDLARTVDYSLAYQVVRAVVEGASLETLEAVAERSAGVLLAHFVGLESVRVQVKKPGAPIAGAHIGQVAVEVTRGRGGRANA